MKKELEAFNLIKNCLKLSSIKQCLDYENIGNLDKELSTLENAIERLRKLELIFPLLNKNAVAEQENRNKALEIIIEKNVDIVLLKTTNDFTTYNELRIPNKWKEHICINDYMLTRENYSLLKEVLDYE